MMLAGMMQAMMLVVSGVLPPTQDPAAPPVGSPPVYRAIELRFEPENVFTFVEPATYLHYLRTRPRTPGSQSWRPYDEQELLDDFDRLMATGFVDDLRIEVTDVPFANGVIGKHVTFVLEERERVKVLSYRGADRIGVSTIEEALKELKISVAPDSFLDHAVLRRITGVIRDLYVQKGFLDVTATPTVQPVEGGPKLVSVEIDVDEGPQTRVLETEFAGNTSVTDATLRRQMQHTREPGVFSFVRGLSTYSDAAFAEDAVALERFYRDRGHIAARIGQPEVTTLRLSEDGRTRWVRVSIPLDEGPQYRVGAVTFAGNVVLPEAALAALFTKIAPGEYYRHRDFESAREVAQKIYGAAGYMDFTMYPDLTPRPDAAEPIVDVVVRLEEGPQYQVRRLSFAGHTTTRDEVIRREFHLVEGGIFNTDALKNSVRRLNQLGYFKPIEDNEAVSISPVPKEEVTNPDTHAVDIRVRVEEQNRNQFTFGAGVSQFDGVFGNLGFQTSNFLGRGETVSVSAQRGQLAQTYQLAASKPYLWSRPIGAGVSVFSNKVDYRDDAGQVYYSDVRQGVAASAGLSKGFFRFQTQVAYEVIDTALLDGLGTGSGLRDGRHIESRVSPSVTYNTVDHPLFPRRGLRVTLGTDIAGGPLGGSLNYFKPEGEAVAYLPIGRRLSIGGRASGGWVLPYGDTDDLPYYRRYFVGGETQVRGVDARSVGPLDSTGQPLGGDKFLLFNLEASWDLGGPVRLIAFHDAGQAFAERDPFNIRKLRTSSGVELRVLMPIIDAPVRLIYAWNLYRDTFQPFRGFRFAVGTTF